MQYGLEATYIRIASMWRSSNRSRAFNLLSLPLSFMVSPPLDRDEGRGRRQESAIGRMPYHNSDRQSHEALSSQMRVPIRGVDRGAGVSSFLHVPTSDRDAVCFGTQTYQIIDYLYELIYILILLISKSVYYGCMFYILGSKNHLNAGSYYENTSFLTNAV